MGFITDLLKDVPLSAVLKERLAIADKEIETMKSKHTVLESENTILKSENANLDQLNQQKDQEIQKLKQKIKDFHSSPRFSGGIRA